MNSVHIDIKPLSYEGFIRDLENGINGKFKKFYFKFPRTCLEDRLSYIWNDRIVINIVLYYPHHGLVEVYGEYVDDEVGDEAGQCDGQSIGKGVSQGSSIGDSASECVH